MLGRARGGTGMGLETLKRAAKYWEPRRLPYNAVLTGVAVVWVVATWPHFRGAVTAEHMTALAVLALLANVCYCAAYLVEIPMSGSEMWARRRWGLWLIGMVLAFVLENYWIADEIYPDVR